MAKFHIPTLGLTIGGVTSAAICLSLLIAAQVKQFWIKYSFTETGSFSYNTGFITITSDYTAVANAEIGLYDTYYVIATDFVNALVPDTTVSDTVDSATTGYFDEAQVKACRALAIVATIAVFAAAVCGVLSIILKGQLAKILRISAISAAGTTTFLATVAMIVVRTEFKSGMEIELCFILCVVADIMAAISTGCYVAAMIIVMKVVKTCPEEKSNQPDVTKTPSTDDDKKKEQKI